LAYKWCAVGVQLVCKWCASGVQVVCTWCASGVQLVCKWCAVGVQLVYSWCTVGVQLVCKWCASGVQVVCSLCASGVQVAYSWCASGVHVAYSWCTVGVQVVYSWCAGVVQVACKWRASGVQVVYNWCAVGVQLVYSWCACKVHWLHLRHWLQCGFVVVYKWSTLATLATLWLRGVQAGSLATLWLRGVQLEYTCDTGYNVALWCTSGVHLRHWLQCGYVGYKLAHWQQCGYVGYNWSTLVTLATMWLCGVQLEYTCDTGCSVATWGTSPTLGGMHISKAQSAHSYSTERTSLQYTFLKYTAHISKVQSTCVQKKAQSFWKMSSATILVWASMERLTCMVGHNCPYIHRV